MVMKRIIAGFYLCIMAVLSTGAYQVWDITPLDLAIFPGGFSSSNAWSINNNKQIIGYVGLDTDYGTERIPAVWDFSDPDGWGVSHTMPLEIPDANMIWPYFGQINDNGQVCGSYTYAACQVHAWDEIPRPMIYDIYTRTARDLGCLGDDDEGDPFLDYFQDCYMGGAAGINNAGTVVGWSQPSEINAYGLLQVGVLHQPTCWMGGAEPLDMGPADYGLRGINNNNLMIGTLPAVPELAYTQSGNAITVLPLPPECSGWASRAEDINDEGMIVGFIWGQGSSDDPRAILWHPEEGLVQLPCYPGYTWGSASAINKHGMIVGASNGAVVWIGAGNNYQVVSLNMCKAQTGWTLIEAKDINDDGWIVGWGEYNGTTMGFLARPRLDENPPMVNLDADHVENKGGQVTINVLYSDDNGMNTGTMDNKDIEVIYPNGTKVAAQFKSVKELDPDPETGNRKYQAKYCFSTPPMNPMRAEGTIVRIVVAESEVSDLSGRYVSKGQIGELELSLPWYTATLMKGSVQDIQTSTTTWKFKTWLYFLPDNTLFQILGVKFQAPGSSAWYNMTSSDNGTWSYEHTAANAAGLSVFGDGDYTFAISLDFGGPFEMEETIQFGRNKQGQTIPVPTTTPSITSPQQGSTVGCKNIDLRWVQPDDPAITSIICSVVDTASGKEVFNQVFLNGSANSAGPAMLSPNHSYTMTVYFCSGDHNVPEEDDWSSYKLKYTSTKVSFFTQQPVGDLNDDGAVDMKDLSLLSAYWKKTSAQAGWKAQYDLQPNGVIDLGDLAAMAQHWLE